jgi:signal transduction histidine kinase
MSPEAELQLFRITQEALRNVRKHAQATEVVINIEFTDDSMVLSIIDNGVGFNEPGVLSSLVRRGKLGLLGMNERTNLLGGISRLNHIWAKEPRYQWKYRLVR